MNNLFKNNFVEFLKNQPSSLRETCFYRMVIYSQKVDSSITSSAIPICICRFVIYYVVEHF